MSTPSSPPLGGLLILDLTRAVAGPFATMLLGDLGARVIKVEEEGHGDETRGWGPPFLDGISSYFLTMNRNKESVGVNLKQDQGRALLKAMAAKADVLIENFRPGVMDRLGFSYQQLSALNPRLVYASISGFGFSGPLENKPGYDLIVQAMSGLMHASAAEGSPPVKVAPPISDILTALFTGQAILAALYGREKTGCGRRIQVSLLEGMLCAMSNLAGEYLMTGTPPRRVGTAQANIVPYQMFRCQDASIVAGAPNERLWARFCQALGQPQWLEQEKYRGNAARNQHRDELVQEIEQVLARAKAADWIAKLEEHEIPCGPVLSIAQALAQPQVASQAGVVELQHPKLGPLRMVGNPMRMDGFQPEHAPPPELNEHGGRIIEEFLGGPLDRL